MEHFSGVLVNTLTVLAGSTLGLLLKKGIPQKFVDSVMKAIGLCTIAIGITGIMKGQNQLVMIISLVLGVIVGTALDIDGKINRLGDYINSKMKKDENSTSIAEGFVTSSLLFCIGAMTIVGAINAGVSEDNQTLYTKSLLDFISSTLLSASLGIGVLFSSVFVLVFQGSLVILSMWLGSFLSDFAIAEIVCAGSVMILALGLNLIGLTKIKVADMLPALIFVPLVCMVMPL